ncbi:scavenger receptor cysteine-rich domain-containing protein DMBT1-like [Mobula birostris]|uniref:scavenger receptor cysteine-rich domain-containing protein DMBT1-like n=1 Tax=Mobula birostris TaxID=1983395 RepID=UPI003B287E9A
MQESEMQILWILVLLLHIPSYFGEVRMVGDLSRCVGDLQIKFRDQWLPVCSSQWNTVYGDTLCRQVGCGSYDNLEVRPISPEDGPVLLNNLQCKGNETSLLECSFTVSNLEECQSGTIVYIYCKDKEQVVLSDGGSPCAGRVEATNYPPLFFIICGRNWDMNEADVLCKFAGCGDAVSSSGNSQFGYSQWPVLQTEISCSGTENNPWTCERRQLAHPNCSKESEAAGVVCAGHRMPRLVDGYDECSGRLEVQHGESWGSVCDSNWDLQDARVVCRSLKCGEVISVIGGAYFGEGSGLMWQESYECEGNETILWDCATKSRNEHNCTHRSAVSVICSGQKGLRLIGGMNRCSGRVEVLRGETWGTVCDVFWDLEDAAVVCNHLHCGAVHSAPVGAFFGEGNGPIWKDVTECHGNEMRLNDCRISSWRDHPCTHKNDAGVICSADHWHLRLAAGEGRCDGRVEVYHSGVWGRVTDDLWDFKDADVVCRQLKCGSAVNVYNHGKYGIGKGPVIMSNVSCIGGEIYFWNCTFTQVDHLPLGGDVGVFCSDNIPVRLVNGASRCAGRVEVYYNGIWGTVCDDAWDLIDAHVVCKELNCGHAVNATKSSWFGQGSGPIWMDKLKCSANNSALWQCPARPWGENDCIHKEDAGIICSDHREIRLANGKNPCQGRLEVFFNGTWGTVCSDSFGLENAQVVCSQLNCGSAKLIENTAAFGEGKGPIWLDDVRCRLGDSLLWQCPSSAWGQHNCKHEEDVAIICSEIWPSKPLIEEFQKEKTIKPFPKASNLRLVAGFDNCSGRIEVFFSGTWGTVCDDSWDRHDAAVVCRQLNCGDPVLASGGILFPLGNRTIWMDEVKCKGSEHFLSDCQFSALHRHDCGHKETVGVICSDHQPHTPTFRNLKAFIYAIPFILGSLLVIVSLYLIKSRRRQFQYDDKKSRPSTHRFAEPFYEEIAFQETGPAVGESQSISSADKLEYYLDGDLHGYQNENMEESPLPLGEKFGEEYDDIE